MDTIDFFTKVETRQLDRWDTEAGLKRITNGYEPDLIINVYEEFKKHYNTKVETEGVYNSDSEIKEWVSPLWYLGTKIQSIIKVYVHGKTGKFDVSDLVDDMYWETVYNQYKVSDKWETAYNKIEELRLEIGLDKRYKTFTSFKRNKSKFVKDKLKSS